MPDLAATLRALLPDGAATAATDPLADYPAYPSEHIAAIPRRQREFAAGRAALRAAMAELDLPPVAIRMNADRSPALPPGLAASISHTHTVCLAAAMTGPRGLGIDVEPDEPLPGDLADIILTPAENRYRPDARVIFAAKEALYKAQYPVTRSLLAYDAVAIALEAQHFTATVLQPFPGFPAGARLVGRWARSHHHIVTALVI